MALSLLIDAVERFGLVRPGTLTYTDELHTRSNLQCQLAVTKSGGVYWRPAVGEPVTLLDGATKIFGGSIERIRLDQPPGVDTRLFITVECVSWDQIADRRLVSKDYTQETVRDIVLDLMTEHLVDEGVSEASIDVGPVIERLPFNFKSVTEAFNEIAELVGFEWWIDADKGLHFVACGTEPAPSSFTSRAQYQTFQVTSERADYRNRQFVRAGQDKTEDRTEEFVGDSKRRTFNLSFPVAEKPSSLKINAGAEQTLGVRGIEGESTAQWFYQIGATELNHSQSETVLTASDTVTVIYKGFFPLLILSEDQIEITARAAVEGGTGVYEAIEDKQEIDSAIFALDLGAGLLRRKGLIPQTVLLSTLTAGFRAGQLVTITNADFGVNGDFLIARVEFGLLASEPPIFGYRLECLSGEAVGGWAEFWMRIANAGRKFVVRENEVLGPLIFNQEPLDATEDFTVQSQAAACGEVDVDEIGMAEVC
ncbi:hypothetical protein [Candidatus Nitronereus thalassa]|uniref:Phage late control gene D protein (GPD) n=1 Tax=Candidatus Nitronereus thalassa TaxID=3020898 RepID=A0ABU3K3C0_9BACT|nr:hypothetical protein [Candidatus Nitronereus thalassa]MDT7040881.1 hypothetical protein [Candidatus Nitronereus thalassa]